MTMMTKTMIMTITMDMWNKSRRLMTIALLLCVTALAAMGQVPERPNPPRLVNDFAGILGTRADCHGDQQPDLRGHHE